MSIDGQGSAMHRKTMNKRRITLEKNGLKWTTVTVINILKNGTVQHAAKVCQSQE